MAAVQYAWYANLVKELDAQTTGEYLETLVTKYSSKLTTDEVLADARSRTSPLHKGFTWDDTVAGEKWRKREAKTMLKALIIKDKDKEKAKQRAGKTRAFVFVHVPGYDRKVYVPLRTAMQDAEMKAQVIESALRDLNRWMGRWGGRSELSFVSGRVERLRKAIEVEFMTASGVFR